MAIYFMWKCNNCELFNHDENQYCQACFQKATCKSRIHSLESQQKILFDGYVRTEIINVDNNDDIPIDILNYCFHFFGINIKLLCIQVNRQLRSGKDLYELTRILHWNEEYFFEHQILSMLIKIFPDTAELHDQMGLLFSRWGNPKRAAVEFKQAIDFDPTDFYTKGNYGMFLQTQHKWDLALAHLLNANKLEPNNFRIVLEIARCYESTSIPNRELATFYFLKAIELNPKEAQCYYCYAVYLRKAHNYKESDKYYQKCLQIAPQRNYSNASYAFLLFLMKRFDEAQKYLDIDFSMNYKNAWAHYYQGILHKHAGNDRLALQSLCTAVNIWDADPHHYLLQSLEEIITATPNYMEYHTKCFELFKTFQALQIYAHQFASLLHV